MIKLLHRNKKHHEVGKQINNLWDLRKKLIEEPNKVTPIGRCVTGQNINPSPGGWAIGPSQNPSPGGHGTENRKIYGIVDSGSSTFW